MLKKSMTQTSRTSNNHIAGRAHRLPRTNRKEHNMKSYIEKIYPCDLDICGECPKAVCDCKNCIPYEIEYEEEEEE